MVEVPCAACGSLLKRSPSDARDHPHLFCNRRCYANWQSENQKGGNNHNSKPRIPAPCDNCGALLFLTPYQVSAWDTHFCNQQCRGEWMTKTLVGADHPRFARVRVSCVTCGKVLLRQPNEIGRHQFCNVKCMGAWFSEHRSGVRSHRWRGGPKQRNRIYYGPNWSAQRKAARQRDGFKCQGCGRAHFRIRHALSVHHVVPFRTFGYKAGENDHYLKANTLTNLICLCSACHRRAELGKIPLQLKLL